MALESFYPHDTHTHTHPFPVTASSLSFFNIIISSLSPPLCDLSSSRPPTSPLTHLPRVPPFRPSSAPPLLTSLGNLLPAVVPVLLGDSQTGSCQPLFGRELPDIPQLDGLVLRVADQVASVTLAPWQNGKKKETEIWELEQYMWLNKHPVRLMFSFKPFPSNWKTFYWETPPHRHIHTRTHLAVDEGDAVSVAGQLSNRLRSVLPQRPSVPHLAQCVIAAREQQLGRAVGERHRVHVVLVGINLMRMAAKERVSVYCMERVHMCARMCYLQVGYLHVVVKSVCVCAHLCMSVPMQK